MTGIVERPRSLRLDPWSAATLPLDRAPGAGRRALIRALLLASGGCVRVEGSERLPPAGAVPGAIFALSHHNAWEAVFAPTALVALRRGRPIRFLVDWMFAELPFTGWLVRSIDPIPVYAKRARFGLREERRRSRLRFDPLVEAAAALARGEDVGVYPEGSRQRDPWRLGALRGGVAKLSLASGAPIVPVGVELPARARLGRLPRVGRIVLRIGEPIPASVRDGAALLELLETSLAELSRKETAPRRNRIRREEKTMRVPFVRQSIEVTPVASEADRAAALLVVDEVYRGEKRWIASSEQEIAEEPAAASSSLWLLARRGGEPVGVMRLVFDPELTIPESLGLRLEEGVDLERLARSGRFAEIGRMMVRASDRRRPAVVLALMRAALAAALERGVTHLLTAVFEDDPHSPHDFHVRQLGFERVGTHERGELHCASRRILLVLDLRRAWARLGRRQGVAAELARGFEARLEAAPAGI